MMPLMPNSTLMQHEVRLGTIGYPYHFGYDCMGQIASSIGRLDVDRFLLVTDDTVLGLHGEKLIKGLSPHAPVTVLSGPPGERLKSAENLSDTLQRAIRSGATRNSVVVAFGGGVPGNLAGVIAGLLFRGVRLVHVPTTTVAAMDSTISLKQAINSEYGKNHIGTYYRPEAVYTDVQVLQTLPDRDLRSGFCEATKNALAIHPDTIPRLRSIITSGDLSSESSLRWLLDVSLAAKASVTGNDPHEQGTGLILEYGHTVGHAIEICDQRIHGSKSISHGDAVVLGMRISARVSGKLGGLSPEEISLHDELAQLLGVPHVFPDDLCIDDISNTLKSDNKRGYLNPLPQEVVMVLLSEIGTPMGHPELPLTTVPLDLVNECLKELSVPRQKKDLSH